MNPNLLYLLGKQFTPKRRFEEIGRKSYQTNDFENIYLTNLFS